MKQSLLFCAVAIVAGSILPAMSFAAEGRAFKHPSVMSAQEDLAALHKRVISNPSADLGYEQLRTESM